MASVPARAGFCAALSGQREVPVASGSAAGNRLAHCAACSTSARRRSKHQQGARAEREVHATYVQQPAPALPCTRSALLRMALFSGAAAAAAGGSPLPVLQPASAAAATLPPLQRVAAGLAAGAPRSSLVLADPQLLPMPPGPIAFPRRQLGLNFAVLLMRSGYEACDDLDFIPMDEYQKRFWKLRQAEWQPYTLLHAPLRIPQGKLDDPLYFDFINFSQAAAAGVAMAQGKQIFEEYDEESEGKVLVTRDPLLSDNSLLPVRFFERQGDRIYHGLVEGFRGEQFAGPLPCEPGATSEELLSRVQALLDIFMDRGYAIKATLTPGGSASGSSGSSASGSGATTFTVRLEGPANLWSLQALAARRSNLYSQHDAAAVAALLRASGRSSTCRLSWNDTAVTQQWTVEA